MKFFNTAGPVNRDNHYKLNPLERWDLEEILILIEQEKYFLLHAPRQTGKTSCLLALRDYLNKQEKHLAIYCNLEAGQAARGDVARGITAIVSALVISMSIEQRPSDLDYWCTRILNGSPEEMLHSFLTEFCRQSKKPIVLLLDEVDALVGDSLISVLRQIRSGYDKRPDAFPVSMILCGVRDIKDYRMQTADKEIITGGSAFNIKSESLTLGNFSKQDVCDLYQQHTDETGQVFHEDCYSLIMRYTGGQPWLVNALGHQVTFKMKENRDRSVEITTELMAEAKEQLVLSRQTHLDQLADKLKEDRVLRVIKPMILGEEARTQEDDFEYCNDLGLIHKTEYGWEISNDIYREIIPRELTKTRQDSFLTMFRTTWVREDGSMNSEIFFNLFQTFWRENSDIWASHIKGYNEAAPHLVFQAFLQRVANGTGRIDREYALGTRRLDLMLKWRFPGGEQRIVIELKVFKKNDSLDKLRENGLKQVAIYADSCDATETHLMIFDRDEKLDWREKVYQEETSHNGHPIKIWGM